MTIFSFDVESLGFDGSPFAAGYSVMENGEEIESDLWWTDPLHLPCGDRDREWVTEYILSHLTVDAQKNRVDSIFEVAKAASVAIEQWTDLRGAYLMCDCPYPFETQFLERCIRWGLLQRRPYPLIDLASVRLAAGIDPIGTERRYENELPKHNPLKDARQSGRLFFSAMGFCTGD